MSCFNLLPCWVCDTARYGLEVWQTVKPQQSAERPRELTTWITVSDQSCVLNIRDRDSTMTCEFSEGQQQQRRTETVSLSSMQECQICFNPYSPWRRPKVLQCLHTCCSACLGQLWRDHREIRCPWCRCVTPLPAGQSVSQLPDDPDALAVISERVPVFVRLPDSNCYLLPLPGDVDQTAPTAKAAYRFDFKGRTLGEEDDEDDEEEGLMKSSTWTGFCTVILVALILIFLLGIVLHNMSCVSKRFSIISCG